MTRWTATDRIVAPGQRCDHCGETGLKRTVVIASGDQTMNVGTGCAEKLTGHTRSRINTAISRAEKERRRVWDAWDTELFLFKARIQYPILGGPGLDPDSPSEYTRDRYHQTIADWKASNPEPPRPKEE